MKTMHECINETDFGLAIAPEELQEVAREWVTELEELIMKTDEQQYPVSVVNSYAAQISWIKMFFNLKDKVPELKFNPDPQWSKEEIKMIAGGIIKLPEIKC